MATFLTLWSGVSRECVLQAASKSSLYNQGDVADRGIWEEQPPLARERLASWLAGQRSALSGEGAVWWHTSGTTGNPLAIAFPTHFHSTYLRAAYRRLFPVRRDGTGLHAHLCAPRIAPAGIDLAAEAWESRIQHDDLYLMAKEPLQEWTSTSFARIHRDLNEVRPQTLRADPFYLAAFLRWLIRNGKPLPVCPTIVCSYSPLTANLRKVFAESFRAQVWDLFAMSECGPLYFYDGSRLVPWDDGILYEGTFLAADVNGEPVYSGFVSSVRNAFYPLLRYQSGDLFQRIKGSDGEDAYVNCGRAAQAVPLPDGTLITQRSLDQILQSFPQIWAFAALVRGRHLSVELMFEPGAESNALQNEAAARLRDVIRDHFEISVRAGEICATQPSGKVTPIHIN